MLYNMLKIFFECFCMLLEDDSKDEEVAFEGILLSEFLTPSTCPCDVVGHTEKTC